MLGMLLGARSALALDAGACGSLDNAYGPFDYESASDQKDHLPVVEKFHFTPGVESLVQGQSGAIVADLDYTLRAFPNHHRALYAMARYRLAHPRTEPNFYTAECYFDRAMRWRPEDGTVRLIYGIYLSQKADHELEDARLADTRKDPAAARHATELAQHDRDAALEHYQHALDLTPDSPEVHYNMGLLYCDLGKLELARQHADRAYELGYPLPGLRNRLRRLGAYESPAAQAPKPAAQR
jgi:Tfp pilus assembly protein PilF